jgi:hypothetical protein
LEKRIIAKVIFEAEQQEKTHAALEWFKGIAWVSREFLNRSASPNQRSLSGNSFTSAAARMSQQKQQAWPADWRNETCIGLEQNYPDPLLTSRKVAKSLSFRPPAALSRFDKSPALVHA